MVVYVFKAYTTIVIELIFNMTSNIDLQWEYRIILHEYYFYWPEIEPMIPKLPKPRTHTIIVLYKILHSQRRLLRGDTSPKQEKLLCGLDPH